MVMLVTETDNYEEQIDSNEWIGEVKRDGNRLDIVYANSMFKFYNRKGDEYTKGIPKSIMDELCEKITTDNYCTSFRMDGEITYTDEDGRDHRTQAQCKTAEPILWLWDIIELNGEDLTEIPWLERKTELKTVCDVYEFNYTSDSVIRYLPHFIQKRELLKLCEKQGMEGIVLKKIDAPYVDGKSKAQIKIKFTKTDDFVVVGYTNASKTSINTKGEVINNKRYPYFKALILAQYDKDGNLKSKGQVGGGFTSVDKEIEGTIITSDLDIITPMLDKDNEDKIIFPFDDKDFGQTKGRCKWLSPEKRFVVEVKYDRLTEYGNPFLPRFLTLREDKKIEECKEQ